MHPANRDSRSVSIHRERCIRIEQNPLSVLNGQRTTSSIALPLIALCAIAVAAEPAAPQNSAVPPCRVHYARTLTIGPLTSGSSFSSSTMVSELGNGRLLIGPTYRVAEMVLADTTGRIIRTWGRAGDGPGETREIVAHTAIDSTSYLVADIHRRFTVFRLNGEYVRGFQLGIPGIIGQDLLRLNSNLFVGLIAFKQEPKRVDPLVLFDSHGKSIARIGFAERGLHVYHGDHRGFWYTDMKGHTIQYYPIGNTPTRTSLKLARERPRRLTDRARFGVSALWLDEQERLWILGYWQTHPRAPSGVEHWTWLRSQGIDPLSPSYFANTSDPIIEILDTRTGRLLVQQELPKAFLPQIVGDGSIVEIRERSDGEIVVLLHRVQVSCTNGGER